ncbi:MAG: gamma carbonic anhydrase family protein [Candidatus Omnitrophica bacterium]|nr:gamma carbonic anhydrase family protein [Candidatus Omnitrophota bacterium]
MSAVVTFHGKRPKVHPSAFIAESARVVGNVILEKNVSIWFGAVLRGDINRIVIGEKTNIQDNCVLHVDHDAPCRMGGGIITGHLATVHACTVEDECLIGIHSVILSKARIGTHSIIGSGAIVREGDRIPPRSLVLGVPGKVVRTVTKAEIQYIRAWADRYHRLAQQYLI